MNLRADSRQVGIPFRPLLGIVWRFDRDRSHLAGTSAVLSARPLFHTALGQPDLCSRTLHRRRPNRKRYADKACVNVHSSISIG